MGLIKRIETGMTTSRDAQIVKDIMDYNESTARANRIRPVVILMVCLGFLLLGLSIGGFFF